MRGRKRPNFPLSLIVWEEKLWCHRCAITNITHMCSRKKLSCPKWMNEQHEVYFLAPGFLLLCNSFCFSSSSSSFFSLKTWTQQELKYENPVILTGWSCLQVHLFILLMRLIFICTDRLSIGGNGHLLVLPGDFFMQQLIQTKWSHRCFLQSDTVHGQDVGGIYNNCFFSACNQWRLDVIQL